MKKFLLIVLVFLCVPLIVSAKQGCCSKHKGVKGCNSNGWVTCKDGTISPTCTCTPPTVKGCTDPDATNYNPSANKDDNSCKYEILGCTNPKSTNYNEKATKDDGSCEYIKGCTDTKALNYNEKAFIEDFSCEYEIVEDNENIEEDLDNTNIINNENIEDNEDVINNNITEEKNDKSNNSIIPKEEVIDTKKEEQKDNDDDSGISFTDVLVTLSVLGGGGYFAVKKIKG